MPRSNYLARIAQRSQTSQALLRPPHLTWRVQDDTAVQAFSTETPAVAVADVRQPSNPASPSVQPAVQSVGDAIDPPQNFPVLEARLPPHPARQRSAPAEAAEPIRTIDEFAPPVSPRRQASSQPPSIDQPPAEIEQTVASRPQTVQASPTNTPAVPNETAPAPVRAFDGPTPFLSPAIVSAVQRARQEAAVETRPASSDTGAPDSRMQPHPNPLLGKEREPDVITPGRRSLPEPANVGESRAVPKSEPPVQMLVPSVTPPAREAVPQTAPTPTVSIGSIDVHIAPPQPPAARPAAVAPRPAATGPLARGFSNTYGLRQR